MAVGLFRDPISCQLRVVYCFSQLWKGFLHFSQRSRFIFCCHYEMPQTTLEIEGVPLMNTPNLLLENGGPTGREFHYNF